MTPVHLVWQMITTLEGREPWWETQLCKITSQSPSCSSRGCVYPGWGTTGLQVLFLPVFCLKAKSRQRAAGATQHPEVPIAVSCPSSASQGGVIFLGSLSEKQMTDAFFELCNQEQAGGTNCSVYWTSFYVPSSTPGDVIAGSVMFIAKKKGLNRSVRTENDRGTY